MRLETLSPRISKALESPKGSPSTLRALQHHVFPQSQWACQPSALRQSLTLPRQAGPTPLAKSLSQRVDLAASAPPRVLYPQSGQIKPHASHRTPPVPWAPGTIISEQATQETRSTPAQLP